MKFDANSLLNVSVAELHTRQPETLAVFMQHRMACVGCSVAAFEAVSEAIAIYRLDPEQFTAELARAIQKGTAGVPPAPQEKSK